MTVPVSTPPVPVVQMKTRVIMIPPPPSQMRVAWNWMSVEFAEVLVFPKETVTATEINSTNVESAVEWASLTTVERVSSHIATTPLPTSQRSELLQKIALLLTSTFLVLVEA